METSRWRKTGFMRRVPRTFRYYPYGSSGLSNDIYEEIKGLGVDLSLCVAESMFLLSEDIRAMLYFCAKLWRDVGEPTSPVSERLLRVMHYVYSKQIEPYQKNRGNGCGVSVQREELIRSAWEDSTGRIRIRHLHRLVLLVKKNTCYFQDYILCMCIRNYKQLLKRLEDKLRPVSMEANALARETRHSISDLWKSLYDEDETPQVLRDKIVCDLFHPILPEIQTLPVYAPFIVGKGYAEQKLREEAVQLGVELSLYVAECMFLLCDDVSSMLRFCFNVWRDAIRNRNRDSPVLERLVRVFYYVYLKDIKPMNGELRNGGESVQWRLITTTWSNFVDGIRDLDRLVLMLRGEHSGVHYQSFKSSVGDSLKEVDDKLRVVKAVSEANGFAREAMESNILDLWKSVFDKEAKEATQTIKVIRLEMLRDLFLPQWND
ncbi:hypothetical protein CARUB_v10020319mg [Capsella rubella]|uniref:Uncharacterized protein n=1 Tax=Capsella rubella TaxID=81985 RepID=R0HZ50_9BRAS|nr:uncharacterized protein LOC17895429 [Capsella rubella]EOA35174.1 hypothetical protein CARUB_v10020319mg [Capsella rubella]